MATFEMNHFKKLQYVSFGNLEPSLVEIVIACSGGRTFFCVCCASGPFSKGMNLMIESLNLVKDTSSEIGRAS